MVNGEYGSKQGTRLITLQRQRSSQGVWMVNQKKRIGRWTAKCGEGAGRWSAGLGGRYYVSKGSSRSDSARQTRGAGGVVVMLVNAWPATQ